MPRRAQYLNSAAEVLIYVQMRGLIKSRVLLTQPKGQTRAGRGHQASTGVGLIPFSQQNGQVAAQFLVKDESQLN